MAENPDIPGVMLHSGYLGRPAQDALARALRDVVAKAPLFSPMTPWGKPMKVRMTSAGSHGWVSDRRGYRYEPLHPNGTPWPQIPASVLKIWEDVSNCARAPECCLLNYYGDAVKMGMHQDKDEVDFSAPVVSISLGDTAKFRIGGVKRGGPTTSLMLKSGDVLVMGGPARMAYHGIDRIEFGSSDLLLKGGRINLTLRVVT